MKIGYFKKNVGLVLIMVFLVVLAGCQNSVLNKFESSAKKYLRGASVVCDDNTLHIGGDEQARAKLEIYSWHMTRAGKDTEISVNENMEYCVVTCGSFEIDNMVFDNNEYPYAAIQLQVFFDVEKPEKPILSVIMVDKYFEDDNGNSYGTFYYPISITADELKNEVYFAGYHEIS